MVEQSIRSFKNLDSFSACDIVRVKGNLPETGSADMATLTGPAQSAQSSRGSFLPQNRGDLLDSCSSDGVYSKSFRISEFPPRFL